MTAFCGHVFLFHKKPVSENQNICLTFGDRVAIDYL